MMPVSSLGGRKLHTGKHAENTGASQSDRGSPGEFSIQQMLAQ
jgi:hypothetical protein